MIQDHAEAILTLLRAAPGTGPLTVLDGSVPSGPNAPSLPYVVVYFADSDPQSSGSAPLTGTSVRFVMRVYCHSVGKNAEASRAVGDRVRSALLDVIPTVSGRACWPIRREDGNPPQRDESTGTLVLDKVDVYRLESIPA